MGTRRVSALLLGSLAGLLGCTLPAGTSTAGGPHPEPLGAKADGHGEPCPQDALRTLQSHVWATYPLHRELVDAGAPRRYAPERYSYERHADGASRVRLRDARSRCTAEWELAGGSVERVRWLQAPEHPEARECLDAAPPFALASEAVVAAIEDHAGGWVRGGPLPEADLTAALRAAGLGDVEGSSYDWDEAMRTLYVATVGDGRSQLEASFDGEGRLERAVRIDGDGQPRECALP